MNERKEKDESITLIAIVVSIIAIIVLSWTYTYSNLKPLDESTRGTFGDMFGGLNALYSGFAFGGIILTIYLQSKELSYQRDELRDTRREFQIQNETLKIQRFENTFFKLIEIHHKILENITHTNLKKRPGPAINNYGTVEITAYKLLKNHGTEMTEEMSTTFNFEGVFNTYYKNIKMYFANYFRNVSVILDLIDSLEKELETGQNKQINDSQGLKTKYSLVLKAQFSEYELLWLFYYGLFSEKSQEIKPLLEKFNILSDLSTELVVNKNHLNMYSIDFKK